MTFTQILFNRHNFFFSYFHYLNIQENTLIKENEYYLHFILVAKTNFYAFFEDAYAPMVRTGKTN